MFSGPKQRSFVLSKKILFFNYILIFENLKDKPGQLDFCSS